MYMQYVTEYDVTNISDTRPRPIIMRFYSNDTGMYVRYLAILVEFVVGALLQNVVLATVG